MAMLSLFSCPSDIGMQQNEWNSNTWARIRGNYVVNFGNTTPSPDAPFTFAKGVRFKEITDGTSNTLLMAEVIVIQSINLTTWHGPPSDFTTSLGGQAFEGYLPPNSGVFDSVARQCPPLPGSLNGVPGWSCVGATELQVLAARSKHSGGVNASLCDGSVRFFANDILPSTWQALSTSRGDSEIVAVPRRPDAAVASCIARDRILPIVMTGRFVERSTDNAACSMSPDCANNSPPCR